MVEIASPGSVIKPPNHSYSGSYGTAARPQKGRPGSRVRLHPRSELQPVASPEMPSPTVCNTNSVTLSTTWPPMSDGSYSVHKASRPGKGQCLTGTQTKPGLPLPSTSQQSGPWYFWCSQHFPAISLREMLSTHIPEICQLQQIPLMVPSQQVGSLQLPLAHPPAQTLSSHSPSFKPKV